MTLDEYNSLPEDLKLDARLAITLGKKIIIDEIGLLRVEWLTGRYIDWQPRQDPAILWWLLGDNTLIAKTDHNDGWYCSLDDNDTQHSWKTKEEAVIRAYCEADPRGHWAKWCKDNEAAV